METTAITDYRQAKRMLKQHQRKLHGCYAGLIIGLILVTLPVAPGVWLTGLALTMLFGFTLANIGINSEGKSRAKELELQFVKCEHIYDQFMQDQYQQFEQEVIDNFNRIANEQNSRDDK